MAKHWPPPEIRFWQSVEKTDTCWNWTGLVTNGYGRFYVASRNVWVHRWSYEAARGPIPEGLAIDHLCKNRRCVNPDHLEAVTPQENVRRSNSVTNANAAKTECKRGHPFTTANTIVKPMKNGTLGRCCRKCQAEHSRAYEERHRG